MKSLDQGTKHIVLRRLRLNVILLADGESRKKQRHKRKQRKQQKGHANGLHSPKHRSKSAPNIRCRITDSRTQKKGHADIGRNTDACILRGPQLRNQRIIRRTVSGHAQIKDKQRHQQPYPVERGNSSNGRKENKHRRCRKG